MNTIMTNGNVNPKMNRLTAKGISFAEDQAVATVDHQQVQDLLEQMRPTLLVFLGGTGQETAVHVKALLIKRFGQAWRHKARLLAFDTTEEPVSVRLGDDLIQLEDGSEFFHIGNVPIPNILRNLDNLEAMRQRLGDSLKRLPPNALRSGAKQVRVLGLAALYWHYQRVYQQLRKVIWALAGRDIANSHMSTQQTGINVFICGSLAGGTGSGTFLDVAYLICSLFADLGEQGDFCHITGIGVLPQAFRNVNGPNLLANTGAALRELNQAMVEGGFDTTYPDGRRLNMPDSPFDLFYVLDGVDERGNVWTGGIHEVTAMAAHGIFLQMASQLGRKGDNAFDNVDQSLSELTEEGDGTFLASYGLGYLEFPAPAVVSLCSAWLLQDQLANVWLPLAAREEVSSHVGMLLHPARAEPIAAQLLRHPQTGGELRVDIRQPGWLTDKPAGQVTNEAVRHVRDYGQARLNATMVGQIEQNRLTCVQELTAAWEQWVNQNLFAPGQSLRLVPAVLEEAQGMLAAWMSESRRQIEELEETRDRFQTALAQTEGALGQAASSLPFGRGGRIREALTRLYQAAQRLYEAELTQAQIEAQLHVWGKMAGHLGGLSRSVQGLLDRLETIATKMSATTPTLLKQLEAGGVSHISLASESYVRTLYHRCVPVQVSLMTLLENVNEERTQPMDLAALGTEHLGNQLTSALQQPFLPLLDITVEVAIAEQAAEMSPKARREQLFRLATPSWSIDRARLPEGGSQLVRLEVLGVPDDANTLYSEEGMLVATHEPYQLVALVVVAGAPQSALMQAPTYARALDKASGPIYVLPHFMTDDNVASLAFALGSIYGLIQREGSYFYYQPGDQLDKPLRLGNGLNNAIDALAGQASLVRELMERVDGKIARLGLQQSIEKLTAYYTSVPDGKTLVDDTMRELKRLVRDYTDELRQMNAFSHGIE